MATALSANLRTFHRTHSRASEDKGESRYFWHSDGNINRVLFRPYAGTIREPSKKHYEAVLLRTYDVPGLVLEGVNRMRCNLKMDGRVTELELLKAGAKYQEVLVLHNTSVQLVVQLAFVIF